MNLVGRLSWRFWGSRRRDKGRVVCVRVLDEYLGLVLVG